MIYLLDINILIALCDEAHEFHGRAWTWFEPRQSEGWATCPISENGFLRIFGNPAYPTGPASIGEARKFLAQMRSSQGHRFWPDDISIADLALFNLSNRVTSRQVTDIYLLGLACRKSGKFATFDQRVETHVIRVSGDYLEIVES